MPLTESVQFIDSLCVQIIFHLPLDDSLLKVPVISKRKTLFKSYIKNNLIRFFAFIVIKLFRCIWHDKLKKWRVFFLNDTVFKPRIIFIFVSARKQTCKLLDDAAIWTIFYEVHSGVHYRVLFEILPNWTWPHTRASCQNQPQEWP